ncbi:hypothetical protein B0A48_15880, partial [Cryoendolithus antarcticus]
ESDPTKKYTGIGVNRTGGEENKKGRDYYMLGEADAGLRANSRDSVLKLLLY